MHVTTLCLGALALSEATGYEIKKMFEEGPFSHFLEASYGSIYPALTRLTEEGLVQCRLQQQDSRPDKKIYALTTEGRDELGKRIQSPPAADRFRSEFLFVLMFAHLLPKETIKSLLDAKVAEFDSDLARLAEIENSLVPGMQFVKSYGEHVIAASRDFLLTHRHWLEGAEFSASPPLDQD